MALGICQQVIGGYRFSDNVLRYGQCHGSLEGPPRLRLTSRMSIEQLNAQLYIYGHGGQYARCDIALPLTLAIIDDENIARYTFFWLKA